MIKILFETALTDVRATDVEGVGTLRYAEDGRIYRWVKNHAATTLTAKQPTCYDVGSVGTEALYESVEEPVTNDLMLNAGIAMTGFAISGGICYGWIQVQGYCPDVQVIGTTNIVVGDELIASNGLDTLKISSAPGTAPIYSSHYVAVETAISTSAAQVKDVMVRCL